MVCSSGAVFGFGFGLVVVVVVVLLLISSPSSGLAMGGAKLTCLFFSFCSFGPSHNRAQDIPGFAEAAREVQLRGLFVGSHDEVVGAAGAG